MFKKCSTLQDNKGFSLIELMVVVAIIGILAAVGVPQYQKFQSKTRQSEAKGHLSAIFTAETAFRNEWSQYTTDLVNIGYAPSGNALRYTAGFDGACTAYSATNGAPAEVGAANSQIHRGANTLGATFHTGLGLAAGTSVNLAGDACDTTAGTMTFTAVAQGEPRSSVGAWAATMDAWTINQNKVLTNSIPQF